MESTIYIRLLGEGMKVYRSVAASQTTSNVYIVGGTEIYDLEDEEWEFIPGSRVVVEEKVREGKLVLIAVTSA